MPLLFALTMFVSASMLFLVQPMVGKMILPLLGGSPAVWNTCQVFFQALLLLGYLYAHGVTTQLDVRKQVPIHLGVLALPLVAMLLAVIFSSQHIPIAIVRSLSPQGADYPVFGVLLLLAIAVGLPFFALSTGAPLLQKWFTATGHPSAKDPYFLYGASNFGSLLSLLSYPFLIEPNFSIAGQTWIFAGGYALLAVLTLICATQLRLAPVLAAKTRGTPPPAAADQSTSAALDETPPTWSRRLRWLLLAFVPSSLMLGVTTYITTDIASLPLLWVIPLSLYLVTFILAFSRLPKWVHLGMILVAPMLTLLLVFMMTSGISAKFEVTLALHLGTFFTVAMVCHGELARMRPAPKYLTGFYLCLSIGGMFGGIFNALAAPIVFKFISEYPLTLILACLALPALNDMMGKASTAWVRLLDVLLPVCIFSFTILMIVYASDIVETLNMTEWPILEKLTPNRLALVLMFGLPAMICYFFVERPLRFGLGVAALFFASYLSDIKTEYGRGELRSAWNIPQLAIQSGINGLEVRPEGTGNLLHRERTYFGSFRITRETRLFPVDWSEWYPTLPEDDRFEPAMEFAKQSSAYDIYEVERIIDGETKKFPRIYLARMQHQLVHGTTVHGKQWTNPMVWSTCTALTTLAATGHGLQAVGPLLSGAWDAWQFPGREPLSYYHRTGPVGSIMRAFEERQYDASQLVKRPKPGRNTNMAFIGLGTGTLSSYGRAGQKVTFFEIDAAVRRLVEPPRFFTYVDEAKKQGVEVEFIMGDARVKLEELREQGQRKFGLMLVDAFSSDAIPVHLLTLESVELYLDLLEEDALLGLHISNRYLNLEPVVAGIVRQLSQKIPGLTVRIFRDSGDEFAGKEGSNWVVITRNLDYLGSELQSDHWRPLEIDPKVPLWTDSFSNLWSVINFRR